MPKTKISKGVRSFIYLAIAAAIAILAGIFVQYQAGKSQDIPPALSVSKQRAKAAAQKITPAKTPVTQK